MKRIAISEIFTDAKIKLPKGRVKIFEHYARDNDEEIIIFTRDEKASLFLSSLPREGGDRYRFFKALKDKAEKFDGQIMITERDQPIMVSVSKIGEVVLG